MTGPTRTPRSTGASRWLPALALLLGAAAHLPAPAQSLVSVDRPQVNLRAGPGTQHPAEWTLAQGYPLQVLDRRNGWLQVRDFEGDTGWVLGRLTGTQPHVVVKVPSTNIRSAPGTSARRVGRAEYGEVLRTLERRPGWLQVRKPDGLTGWVARRLLWGW
jgi:SH3-like domain-containing protein